MTDSHHLADLVRPGLDAPRRVAVLLGHALLPGDRALLAELVDAFRENGGGRDLLDESLLQATLFFGFPRVVGAFGIAAERWPRLDGEGPPCGGLDPSEWPRRGRELFAAIYGRNDAPVRAMLADYHPAFHDFVLEAAYGRVLARPELDAVSRELIAVGWLGVLGQEPQAVAHGRGALALGATEPEVAESLWSGLRDEARAEGWMARITRRA